MYFTLKDADSQLRGIMFKSSVRSLRFEPKDGLRVVARGRIGVYERKGEYQIVCEKLEPEGLGALQLAFDQLKERLTAEGLFDPSRRRTLPVLPRKIGVVTSIGGAAIRDIIHVLRRRYPNSHVVIRPTRVQGDSAAEEVASALSAIARVNGVDVIIVGRGGGSIEDLWTFNEETVARAIAACPVPIISAVGHETDVTIADFVADVRAPTPSAAAELVVGRKEEFTGRIDRLARRVKAGTRTALHRKESLLRVLNARPGYAGFHARATLVARRVTDLTHELRYAIDASLTRRHKVHDGILVTLEVFDLRRRLGALRTRLVQTDGELQNVMTNCRHGANRRLQDAAARLDSLSPLAVLGRGYSVCWNADRTAVIRRANDVQTGHLVRVTLAEGELACKVTMVEMEDTGRK
jgi:exodeoxyribonuclease VII large subunit